MPAFATHEIFSEVVWKECMQGDLSQAVARHKGVYHTGSQGPDLFFYQPFILLAESRCQLGGRMHEELSGAFFQRYLKELSRMINEEEREIAIVYLLGFLTHYTLDATIHPFVYSRVGHDSQEKGSAGRVLGAHHRLEAVMDQQMLLFQRGQSASTYVPTDRIVMTKKELRVVCQIMAKVTSAVYHLRVTPPQVKLAYYSMGKVMTIIYDHSGKRKAKISKMEHMVMGKAFISNLMVNDHLTDEYDALNQSNSYWQNPWKQWEGSKASAWELFDQAAEQYEEYFDQWESTLTQLLHCITIENKWCLNSKQAQQMAQVIGNRSYHQG